MFVGPALRVLDLNVTAIYVVRECHEINTRRVKGVVIVLIAGPSALVLLILVMGVLAGLRGVRALFDTVSSVL